MLDTPIVKVKNPHEIRFIHQTISPTLSKPKPGESKCHHLDAIAHDVATHRQSMLDFPPIEIFSIRDPQSNEKAYYSLNNRKLYIAKKSRSQEINTVKATFEQILHSLWKMTSQSDGLNFPTPTQLGEKECNPTGLLLQFRDFIKIRATLYPLNTPRGSETPAQRIEREAQEVFKLKSR
ncbi:hypothetical protein [Candidatus Berkiella aquae]|uniref:Uncharacterized protein n=1 Tax=Candidatus Berkiella aquae TaxID=295108 RepID=A0A0Q9YPG3_9GAMM|nr:hypothetical protein [Candidatus Berkiella aquae]MCS5711929.1 hypothetical protein [Candidatus Berkiella aquae]